MLRLCCRQVGLLTSVLAATAVLLAPQRLRAAPHQASFTLPAGARVQVAALSDGFTVGLHVDGLEGRALARALVRLHADDVRVLASRGSQSLAYVRFAERVVASQARLGKTTQKRAVQVHLHVTTESPRDAMLAHVLDMPLPVPRTLETDALAQADDAFVHKRLGEAELLLGRLKESGMQRAWVMLRLGDLAVFRDKLDAACAAYNEAQADGGMRTASTLAALRSRVLHCHVGSKRRRAAVLGDDGAAPAAPQENAVDWMTLLRRDGRDDPIGRRMAQEARWALAYEQDPVVLEGVLALQGRSYQRHVDGALRQSLLARLLRRHTPFALAVTSRRGDVLAGHPEAFDLALDVGLAWCALDAPSGWTPPKLASKSWMQLRPRDRARLVQEVSACALSAVPGVPGVHDDDAALAGGLGGAPATGVAAVASSMNAPAAQERAHAAPSATSETKAAAASAAAAHRLQLKPEAHLAALRSRLQAAQRALAHVAPASATGDSQRNRQP